MKLTKSAAAVLIAATTVAGCATIVDGGNQNVNLQPSMGGPVKVRVTSASGAQTLEIPGPVSVPHNKSNLVVAVTDSCYETTQMTSSPSLNPWALGNLLMSVFGLTGTTVDVNSGNAWKYDDTITVPTVKKAGC